MGLLTTADKEKVKIALPKAFNKIIDITIARLYIAYPDPNEWQYTGLWGAVALVDDLVGNTMFLKLVDIQGFRGVLWDQELWVNFEYNQDRTFFHSFEMEDCYAGLLFEDLNESSHFYKRVAKRQKYASKKTLNNKNAMALKKKVDEENQLNVVHGPRGETLISDQRKRYNYDLPQEVHEPDHETTQNDANDEYDFAPPTDSFSNKKAPPPPPPPSTMNTPKAESNTFQQESNSSSSAHVVATPQRVESYASMENYESTPQSESPAPVPSGSTIVHNVPPPPAQYMHSTPPLRLDTAQTGSRNETAQNGGFAFPIPQQAPSISGFGQPGPPPPPPPHPPAGSAYGQPSTPSNMGYGQPPAPPNLPSRSNMPSHLQQAYQPNNFASAPGSTPGLPSRGSVPPPPPARRGAAPPPPPRRHGTAGTPSALQPSRTGRTGPPPPPARRGAAPPPPPRAGVRPAMAAPQAPPQVSPQPFQQPQQQQSNIPAPPSLPPMMQQSSIPAPPPLPPMMQQSSIPAPPPPPPMMQQSNIPAPPSLPPMMQQSNIPAPPPPPPMMQQSSIPAPPPPPPMMQQSNIPAPPPPPAAMGAPSNNSAASTGFSEATGDTGRDALLASIRSAGIGSLKKTDKSQLEKPSVLLQDSEPSKTGPSAPSGGGGPPSMADALAAALQSRKSKVAYNDDDDEGDW